MYPRAIQALIERFSKFPTVGSRTAARFVFYVLKLPQEDVDQLIADIQHARENIKVCTFCFNTHDAAESGDNLCGVCQDQRRTPLLCVIEKESDLETLEKTKTYKGYYFVLGGTVGSLKNEELKNIRAEELKERLGNPKKFGLPHREFSEVIIATNPTTEGEATALYIERLVSPLKIKITKLARGLPMGAELEYADEETLRSALEGRT